MREYGRPSHFVGPVAHETLSTFADRAMNAVDRIGCLPLKYRRSAHGAFVNAVEDRLNRPRPPLERQLDP